MPTGDIMDEVSGLRKDVDRLRSVIEKIMDFLPEPSDDQLLKDAGWTIVSHNPFNGDPDEISLGCTLRWGSSAKVEINALRASYREKRKEAFGL